MADNVKNKISGKTKAAMLFGFFPEETAKSIIRALTAEEKDTLADEISRLGSYDMNTIQEVVEEYLSFMDNGGFGVLKRGEDFARGLLEGEEEAGEDENIKRIHPKEVEPFVSLKRIKDVRPMLTFLINEDPQTIAIIASYMKDKMAAELLEALPEDKRLQVAVAVAKMDPADKETLLQIEEYINSKLASITTSESTDTDGIQQLVGMLNNVKRNTETKIFEQLNELDPELAKVIKERMFVFDDIVLLDKRSVQILVSNIPDNELIAKALKIASEEMKEVFYSNMTQAKKDLVMDTADGLVSLKRSECEEAQKAIADKAKQLGDEKKIMLQRGEEDIIV